MASLTDNIKYSISSLYEYNPAYNNLYEVVFNDVSNNDDTYNQYFKIHCKSITFNGESISMERNKITKLFQLTSTESYKRTDTISLTIRENDEWKIKKYMENWIAQFYNKDEDCYISNDDDTESDTRYRTIKIKFPNNGKFEDDDDSHTLILNKVYPNTSGNIALGWSETASIVEHQLTLYVTSWEWGDNSSSNTTYTNAKNKSELSVIKGL